MIAGGVSIERRSASDWRAADDIVARHGPIGSCAPPWVASLSLAMSDRSGFASSVAGAMTPPAIMLIVTNWFVCNR
jgi:hypothetical protein